MSVSIIIMTNLNERRDWLIHRLIFLDQSDFDGEVLVGVWGGHEQIPYVEKQCAQLIGRCRISIYAQDASVYLPYRLLKLTAECQKEFVVCQGDDDFILPSGLIKAVEILRRDPTVIAAQGRAIALLLGEGITPNIKFRPFPLWEALEDDVIERYCALMKHYTFAWHAVFRKHEFIERAQYMVEMYDNSDDFIFFEAISDLYAVIKGKQVVFNEPYFIKGEQPECLENISCRYRLQNAAVPLVVRDIF